MARVEKQTESSWKAAEQRAPLRISLTGSLHVETNGIAIDEPRFPGRQARLLFAYLVWERDRPIPRDELAELLWGETPPPTWEKALVGVVSKLRTLLADCELDRAASITSAFGCYQAH